MTAQAQFGLGHSFHKGPGLVAIIRFGCQSLCICYKWVSGHFASQSASKPTTQSDSQPSSQLAIQPASQLSHRIMNDISTRGRHEESIIRTERMLIRQQREKKGEKDAGRNRGVNTNGESERCKSQEGGGGAKKARKNSLKRHGWGWKKK